MSEADIDFRPHAIKNADRKPRIALMGEFSAGKSTLMNLLLGCDPMPVRITATRVPPVWVTYGTETIVRLRMDGGEEELDVDALTDAPMDGTQLIRLSLDSDILHLCDLIDIPGISDPNLKHESWLNLLGEVDCVIWCTHATQAWRQSESALWEQMSSAVIQSNFLVVTQFDKLKTERDRTRVLSRLKAETGGVFDAILPISTLDAINAGVDEEAWVRSGGAALIEQLVSTLVATSQTKAPHDVPVALKPLEIVPTIAEKSVSGVRAIVAETSEQTRVVPRRVRPKTTNPERQLIPQKQPVSHQLTMVDDEN